MCAAALRRKFCHLLGNQLWTCTSGILFHPLCATKLYKSGLSLVRDFAFSSERDQILKSQPSSVLFAFYLLLTCALLALCLGCGGGTTTASTSTPPPSFNTGTLGSVTVKGSQLNCAQVLGGDQGAQGASCYQVTVSCPNVADQDVGVKVNAPVGTPVGTILLTTGGTGQEWYDQHFVFGTQIVNRLNAANYAAVQFAWGYPPVNFPSGGTSADG